MIQNAITTKYQKQKSKNFIEIKLNENAFEVFGNTFLLDKYYDILSITRDNQQSNVQLKTCLNLTKLVNHYNLYNAEKISEDIFLNGGFLLDVYENRDYFVQDDIFEYNNERYLLIHNKNCCNRINVIPNDGIGQQIQQIELKNLKQYMMINMGSVDNVGFFLNCDCVFYNKGVQVYSTNTRLSDISIIYKNQWYVCFENNFEFDQIYAYEYYYEEEKKLYPYLNLKDSKILYYIDNALTADLAKHGCSLIVDGITYNTDKVEQVYYGRNTQISNVIMFPYGKNNNIIKTLQFQQKYFCDTYKIPAYCLFSCFELKSGLVFERVIANLNDKLHQYNDWAIQKCYYLTEQVYVGVEKKLQTIIDIIKTYQIEENIASINTNVIQLNNKILSTVIVTNNQIKTYFEGNEISMNDECYVLPKGSIIKYYQLLCENTDMNNSLQIAVRTKDYNKKQFKFNYKLNKWQKGK